MPKKKDKETNPILSEGLDKIEKAINENNLGIAVTLAEELLKEIKKMPNKKEVIMTKKTCGNCKHYQECLGEGEGFDTIHPDNEDCGEWEEDRTDEELEAQRTDAAERENHRREVEE